MGKIKTTEDSGSGNLEAALGYAKRGWRVFPLFYVLRDGACSCRRAKCNRIGKHPTTRNGLQDATTDEATIRRWWGDDKWANIGLATGHGGVVVLDADEGDRKDKHGAVIGQKAGLANLAALESANEPLPVTATCRTGGSGQHRYFLSEADIKNSQSEVGADIDVRGMGGYVILPPSNHATGGKYVWEVEPDSIADLPAWLEKLMLKKGKKVEVEEGDADPEVAKHTEKEPEKLSGDKLVKLLKFIPADCDRDTWWRVGAGLWKELGPDKGWKAFDDWSKTGGDDYDPDVARRHWDSFKDEGITGGTIVKLARDNGFRGFDIEAADDDELVGKWIWVGAIKRFVDAVRLVEIDKEQFDALYAPLFGRGKPSEHVLRNERLRRVDAPIYWPGVLEQIIPEKGEMKLNYWQAPVLPDARRGAVDVFLEHVSYLWPDETSIERRLLLDYLAYMIQKPGEKIHWAILIQGDPGTGKSYFAGVMNRIMGDSNVRIIHNDVLHETFTGWQRNTQLIIVEEMMARQRLDLMNKLKPMITEPWCSIREMYRPPYWQYNRFNFLFFTNHKDSLIIDNKDRRYCVLKSEALPHTEGAAYYKRLFNWLNDEANVAALLWFFLNRDLSEFEAKGHAPMTSGKRELIEESMMPIDRFIKDAVESGEYPCKWDLLTANVLVKPLMEHNIRNATPKDIGNAFARLGYVQLNRINDGSGEKLRLWAVRNLDVYSDMSNDQLRGIWSAQMQGTPLMSTDRDAEAISMGKPRSGLADQKPM